MRFPFEFNQCDCNGKYYSGEKKKTNVINYEQTNEIM